MFKIFIIGAVIYGSILSAVMVVIGTEMLLEMLNIEVPDWFENVYDFAVSALDKLFFIF